MIRFWIVVRKRLAMNFQSAACRRKGPALDEQAQTEHEVGLVGDDRFDHAGDEPRFVLAVGVEHHDHISAALQRLEVAGLLVASVADLMGMLQTTLISSWRARSTVSWVEESSTRITSSTASRGISSRRWPSGWRRPAGPA